MKLILNAQKTQHPQYLFIRPGKRLFEAGIKAREGCTAVVLGITYETAKKPDASVSQDGLFTIV